MRSYLVFASSILIPLAVNAATPPSATAPGAASTGTAPAGTTPGVASTGTAPASAPQMAIVEGPITKLNTQKKTISVKAPNKKYDFVLGQQTILLRNGQPAPFTQLKEGTRVRVTYAVQSPNPMRVDIMQQ